MSKSIINIERTRFTITEVMSVIGGTFSALVLIFRAFVEFWEYDAIDNILVSKLYRMEKIENTGKGSSSPMGKMGKS
jgi:hypothetical protein